MDDVADQFFDIADAASLTDEQVREIIKDDAVRRVLDREYIEMLLEAAPERQEVVQEILGRAMDDLEVYRAWAERIGVEPN
jgi:predicted metal-dependent hydrolase